MEHRAISIWLTKKAASEATLSFVSGILILGGGLVVLFITFIGAYIGTCFVASVCLDPVSQVFLNRPLHVPRGVLLAPPSAAILWLFHANARLRRVYQRKARAKRRLASRSDAPAPLVHLLAFPGASAPTSANVLLCGPRLVEIGFDQLKKARRLSRLSGEDCAPVLAVLASRSSRVPIAELGQTAGVSNLPETCSQLRDLEGVVFLDSDVPWLSLTSDLRNELFRELGIQPRRRIAPVNAASATARRIPIDVSQQLPLSAPAPLDQFEATDAPGIQRAGEEGSAALPEVQRRIDAVEAAYEAFRAKREQKQAEEEQQQVEGVWEQFKQPKKP